MGMIGGALSYQGLDLRGFDLGKHPLRLMSLSGELTAQDLASLQFHSEKQNWRRLKWENETKNPHLFRGSAYEEHSPVSDGVTLSDRALGERLKGSFYLSNEDLSENNKYLVFIFLVFCTSYLSESENIKFSVYQEVLRMPCGGRVNYGFHEWLKSMALIIRLQSKALTYLW